MSEQYNYKDRARILNHCG